MQLGRDVSSNATGSLQHLNTAGLSRPEGLLGCPGTLRSNSTREQMYAGHYLLSTTHQHHHNMACNSSTVTKDKVYIYTLSDNTPPPKMVRNSREGSLLRKRALPYSLLPLVMSKQKKINGIKQKVSS